MGPRHHAAAVRGAERPAVPLVLRRHPDPTHALAIADARPQDQGEPPERRAAMVVPDRRDPVVWRPARARLLYFPPCRRRPAGNRPRRVIPRAHPLLAHNCADALRAWANAGGGGGAPRDRRVVAGGESV